MKEKIKLSIFDMAYMQLENAGIYHWFDHDYYWNKWFEYIEKIIKYIDDVKERTRFKKVL